MTRLCCVALLGASGCVRLLTSPPLPFSEATVASYGNFHRVRADAMRVDSTVVVFPFHPDDTLAFVPRLAHPVGAATLSPAEQQTADSLVQALERAHQLPYTRYRHQYLPVVDGRGAKQVWVNGFCHAPPEWTTQVVGFKGGGTCFYDVQLNLTTRQYAHFSPNADR